MFAALPNRKSQPIFSSTSCNAAAAEASLPKMALTRGVAGLSTTLEEVAGCAALRGGLRVAFHVGGGCAAVIRSTGEGPSAFL